MKATVLSIEGKKLKEISLPTHFSEEIRPDLIKKAVLSIQSAMIKPYGAYPMAGKGYSAKLSRRRRDYKTAYGHGISRVPRKALWHRGRQFGWVGAFAPGTVGGRRAHPPKSTKNLIKQINKKENRKAIRSAIASSINKNYIPYNNIPFIVEERLESLSKTKDVSQLLKSLGLEKELERIKKKTIRAGIGKLRGRKYKRKKGPLFIVSKNCPLLKAAKNLGVDVVNVNNLNALSLAPGARLGRLLIWSLPSIELLNDRKLFINTKKIEAKEDKKQKERKKEENSKKKTTKKIKKSKK